MKILLAKPRGFCAGVHRAVEIVERALDTCKPPVYVKHEVVHNKFVVEGLRARGAIFIEELSEIPVEQNPQDVTVIFSAHGVSQAVRQEAKERGFKIFDATCPLVTKVHMEVARYDRIGMDCILIGHAGHPEVVGTMGQYSNSGGNIYLVETEADVETLEVNDPERLSFTTQTTLSVDDTLKIITALRKKFPNIQGPRKDDICYATQNRQDAVKELAHRCDVFLVIGSKASSNSNRLRELAERMNCNAHLIDGPEYLQREWFANAKVVGITAGASAPEVLVDAVIARLVEWGATEITEVTKADETMVFALPKELRMKQL